MSPKQILTHFLPPTEEFPQSHALSTSTSTGARPRRLRRTRTTAKRSARPISMDGRRYRPSSLIVMSSLFHTHSNSQTRFALFCNFSYNKWWRTMGSETKVGLEGRVLEWFWDGMEIYRYFPIWLTKERTMINGRGPSHFTGVIWRRKILSVVNFCFCIYVSLFFFGYQSTFNLLLFLDYFILLYDDWVCFLLEFFCWVWTLKRNLGSFALLYYFTVHCTRASASSARFLFE
jgi:hypothetical protein